MSKFITSIVAKNQVKSYVMGHEEDYSLEVGKLSSEENDEYLACCQVILANLKRQSGHNERTSDYIQAVEKIVDYHQKAF